MAVGGAEKSSSSSSEGCEVTGLMVRYMGWPTPTKEQPYMGRAMIQMKLVYANGVVELDYISAINRTSVEGRHFLDFVYHCVRTVFWMLSEHNARKVAESVVFCSFRTAFDKALELRGGRPYFVYPMLDFTVKITHSLSPVEKIWWRLEQIMPGVEPAPPLDPLLFRLSDEECAICYEEIILIDSNNSNYSPVVIRLPCRHCFHGDCILKWLRRHATCPFCRAKMPSF